MRKDYSAIRRELEGKLQKALDHLNTSYRKVLALDLPSEGEFDEELLEVWESFAARFSRTVDLFLTRYLRTRLLEEDPGFSGTLRDSLNQAEKLGIIQEAELWLQIRELRNLAAHEYLEEKLARFFFALKELTPNVLAIQSLFATEER
ncbi:MAG: hypothetical protein KDK40_03205 [Chlamydiia bacterium]|nr:hypothetical protein [Chlamydiia bacterium]